jgi:hypothetical protein
MKLKWIIAILLVNMTLLRAEAQILTPVHWSYSAKMVGAGEAEVFATATIDDGWHVYSQHIKDGGPVKTTFTFKPSPEYATDGATMEPKPIVRMESVFNMNVGFFEHSVVFRQKIKLKASQTTIKGTLEYMTCNDHQCLPPEDIDFSIPVK